jgi:hypothetical protein
MIVQNRTVRAICFPLWFESSTKDMARPSLPGDPEPPEVSNGLGPGPDFRYSGIQEGSAMPLRDYFRLPLADRRAWNGVHGQWPAMIVMGLARPTKTGLSTVASSLPNAQPCCKTASLLRSSIS